MKFPLFSIMILASSSLCASEAYLCIAEKATGFSMNQETREWSPSTFDVSRNKIVITKGEKYPWIVKNLGDKTPRIRCENDFSNSVLSCQLGLSTLRMSREHLRYLISYEIGYWSFDSESEDFKEGSNTPYLEIGTCSALKITN
jgi:hypothetical protein